MKFRKFSQVSHKVWSVHRLILVVKVIIKIIDMCGSVSVEWQTSTKSVLAFLDILSEINLHNVAYLIEAGLEQGIRNHDGRFETEITCSIWRGEVSCYQLQGKNISFLSVIDTFRALIFEWNFKSTTSYSTPPNSHSLLKKKNRIHFWWALSQSQRILWPL